MQTTNGDPVLSAKRRTERYWYEDGIWEIGFGLTVTLLSLYYFIISMIDWTGPLQFAPVLLQIAVLFGAGLITNRLVRFLKEHITYPRTGFVSYRKPAPLARVKRLLITALVTGGTAALVASVAAMRSMQNSLPLVIALVMAGMLVFLGYRFQLARLYALAGLTMLLGYVVSSLHLSDYSSMASFFGGFGMLIFISGLINLAIYIQRSHPANPDETSSEEPYESV